VKMKWMIAVLLLAAAVFFSGAARADQIGTLTLADCGGGQAGCPAATYTFDVGPTSATLSVAITGSVTTGVNDEILGVDLGFTPSTNVNGLTLTSNPGGMWTVNTGSLNSGGACGGNNGAFICASSSGLSIGTGGIYTWTWSYTLTDATNIFDVGDIHIGTQYGPGVAGNGSGLIVSETGASGTGPTPAPEPASLVLLGIGFMGIPFFRRKAKRQL